jgi:hypothetical protein
MNDMNKVDLSRSLNAWHWAVQFCKENGGDQNLMARWFEKAIRAGHDRPYSVGPRWFMPKWGNFTEGADRAINGVEVKASINYRLGELENTAREKEILCAVAPLLPEGEWHLRLERMAEVASE